MDVLAGQPNRSVGLFERLFAGDLQLILQVNVRAGEKDVDARSSGIFQGSRRSFDIFPLGARQTGNLRAAHLGGNQLHGIKVALGGDGKASLQHINAQSLQLPGHAQLFRRVHAAARRLLSIAQRRIKKLDAFLAHSIFLYCFLLQGLRAVSVTTSF